MKFINGITQHIVSRGKGYAFVMGFILAFVSVAVLFIIVSIPVMYIVKIYTITDAFTGAIGCGLGVGLFNAFSITKKVQVIEYYDKWQGMLLTTSILYHLFYEPRMLSKGKNR